MLAKSLKIILAIFLLIGTSACTQLPVYKSNWQNTSFQFNNSDENWMGQFYYDKEAKLLYGISNDQENIYLRLKVTDQLTQRKIQLRGLTFWMDSVGKSKEQMTLCCPLPRKQEDIKKMMHRNRNNPDGNKKRPKLKIEKFTNGLEGMEIMGFGGNSTKQTLNNKNKNGINVMMAVNEREELIWEAILPLKMVFSHPEEYQSGGNMYFSFGFETGAFNGPPSGSGQRPQRGGSGGGRQGRGQRGGGMNQQGMEEMQSMMSPSKVKVKRANLSFKPNSID